MAIKQMVIVCDWCEKQTDEYEDMDEAAVEGWWLVVGPDHMDGLRELTYCSEECFQQGFGL